MNKTLLEHHLKDLRSSGLSDETIRLSGCFSADEKTSEKILGFKARPGLAFPFFEEGKKGDFARIKPDKPFVDKKGNKAKYLTPRRASNRLYLLPCLKDILKDPTRPLVITEGEKKTLKANEMGIHTIGLSGVWSWKTRDSDGNSVVVSDFKLIEWKGREAFIAFDSDIAEKEEVQWAEYKLAKELAGKGATVECIRIPPGNNGDKQGLDDYLLQHSREDFWKLPRSKPQEPLPPQIDDLVESFKQKWKNIGDAERDDLLMKMISRLDGCSVLQRSRAMRVLKSVTGHTKKTLEDVFSEVCRRDQKAEETIPASTRTSSSSDLKIVTYVFNEDEQNKLFAEIIGVIKDTKRFYNFNGELNYIHPGSGPVLITERNLNGILSAFLEVAYYARTPEGIVFRRYAPLSSDISKTFIYSPRVLSQFPELKQYTRSPVFDLDWNFIGITGFHPANGIYYDGPELKPCDGTKTLNHVLEDFCWRADCDRANFIGMLLTALTIPHWVNGHPFIAFNGNKPGVGKTLLAKILSIVVDGRMPSTVSFNPNDEEFEKQLATRISEGDRVIIIDNAKRTRFVRQVESQVLERSVTDSTLNFRRLGKNKAISRLNDVIFCLTMNFTKMSRDLRRRNIPVNLEQAVNVRQVDFQIKDMEGYVKEHRLELIAELAGMVKKRFDCGLLELESPAKHSVNQKWAEAIDSILRVNGCYGFLDNFDESESTFDPDYSLMVDICKTHWNNSPKMASEWAAILVEDMLEDRLKNRAGKPKSKRSQAVIVGNLFTQYLDVVLKIGDKDFTVVCEEHGKGHPKTYFFKHSNTGLEGE